MLVTVPIILKAVCILYSASLLGKRSYATMSDFISMIVNSIIFNWADSTSGDGVDRWTLLQPRCILKIVWDASCMSCQSMHHVCSNRPYSCSLLPQPWNMICQSFVRNIHARCCDSVHWKYECSSSVRADSMSCYPGLVLAVTKNTRAWCCVVDWHWMTLLGEVGGRGSPITPSMCTSASIANVHCRFS